MPSLEALGPSLALGLILIVMLWFALGTQRNIRKGNEILRWLQEGLPDLGRRTTLRWFGSSAVELGLVEPNEPFRALTIVVVLEPRDVPLLWAIARWRGRRDFVIVRASLGRSPGFAADVRDPRGWTGRPDGQDPIEEDWPSRAWPAGGVARLGPGADEAALASTWERLADASGGVWRLTVQPTVPHVEVHVRPPALDRQVRGVLQPIRHLAATLARH